MGEIVLTRVDDRLIHGQVMTAWVKKKRGNQILIIDDDVAKDDFMSELLKMSAPADIDIQVKSVAQAISFVRDIPNTDKKVIILVKGPRVIESLLENDCQITEMIVGGMGAKENRSVLYKNISASDDERAIFKKLIKAGMSIDIHVIPDQKAVRLDKYL
ncbi:PTS sugar transporter subunit IIB [Vagococcus sp. BWB3-3]|uniref:PTS sugar transporter subunit IIB n=1 Tax=Vagococcus allomyrinae TaxID=2794353 RepID=A0A940SWM7_9ENTE|nr:PTS sugar transporter subunit IIB [Vagococcus allomyrinae]MBP1042311.1 PTS sugar transporter subunit IIB [Vagococcus allomyrinae]